MFKRDYSQIFEFCTVKTKLTQNILVKISQVVNIHDSLFDMFYFIMDIPFYPRFVKIIMLLMN